MNKYLYIGLFALVNMWTILVRPALAAARLLSCSRAPYRPRRFTTAT